MPGHKPLLLDAVITRACDEAGLGDFGTRVFMPSLRKFVQAANDRLEELSDRGRQGIEDRIVRLLVNRLRMARDTRQHPDILAQELLPPAAIIGLPRTGSTKLQRMLAAGKGLHEVLMWQGYNPAPFPEAPGASRDPRIDAAMAFITSIEMHAPDSQKGHRLVVEEAEEEYALLEQTFETPSPISFFPVYSWCKYIERLDKTAMYAHLRHCLQYLQWQFHQGERKPWLLKYPANLGNESYISRTFPGIRYVVTHRDPFPVMASLIALNMGSQALFCRDPDPVQFSRWAFDEFSSQMERHLAWREASPDAQVLDVSFNDIVKNGMDVAQRIYGFLDLEWTPQTETEIRGWLVENEQQRDKLVYSMADLDFTEDECRARFGDYYARFGGCF